MAMTVSVPGWTRKTNSWFPYEMQERTTQRGEKQLACHERCAYVLSGGAAFVNGNAAYIMLNRDSAEYAIVRGTLNSSASWGSRRRGSFNYQGEQHELRSAGLHLVTRPPVPGLSCLVPVPYPQKEAKQQTHPQKKREANISSKSSDTSPDFRRF